MSRMTIKNPLKGLTEYGWHFEQNVYGDDGLLRAMKAGSGSGNIPKIIDNMAKIYKVVGIEFVKHDSSEGSGGTGYSQWDVVKVSLDEGKEVVCNISNYFNDINESRRDLFRQLPPFSNIEEAYKLLGETLPWIPDAPIEQVGVDYLKPKQERKKIYRIRKLTPRECFRLMGVSDKDIDKIQAYPFHLLIDHPSYSKEEILAGMTEEEKRKAMKERISESQQYKMAGNSIVVQVLEGIFTQMFREDHDALF